MAEVIEIIEKKIDFKKRITTYKGIDTNYDGFPYRINLGNHLTDLFTQDFAVGNEIRSGDLINIHSELDSQRTKLNSYIDEINTYKASKSYLSSLSDISLIPALNVPSNAYGDDLNYTLLSDYVTNIKYLKQAQLDIQDKLHEIRTGILNYAGSLIFIRTDGLNYPTRTYIRPLFVSESLKDIYDIWNDGNINQSYFNAGEVDVGINYIVIEDPYTGYTTWDEYKKHLSTGVATYIKTWSSFVDFSKTHYIVNGQTSKLINGINFKVTRVLRADIRDYSAGVENYPNTYSEYLSGITNGNGRLIPVEFEDLRNTNTQNLTLDFIQKFEL